MRSDLGQMVIVKSHAFSLITKNVGVRNLSGVLLQNHLKRTTLILYSAQNASNYFAGTTKIDLCKIAEKMNAFYSRYPLIIAHIWKNFTNHTFSYRKHLHSPTKGKTLYGKNCIKFIFFFFCYYMATLPVDIWVHVSLFLDVKYAMRISRTCKALYTAIQTSDALWKQLYFETFASTMSADKKTTNYKSAVQHIWKASPILRSKAPNYPILSF